MGVTIGAERAVFGGEGETLRAWLLKARPRAGRAFNSASLCAARPAFVFWSTLIFGLPDVVSALSG